MTHRLSLLAPALCLFFAACGDDSNPVTEMETPTEVAALERAYAGLTESDEVPQFSDPAVRQEDEMDREVPMTDAPDRERAPIGAIVLSMRYGDLANTETASTGTVAAQWRFRVAVDGGRFARGSVFTDDDERPHLRRLEPGVVTWTSTTPPGDHDGARFAIVLGPNTRGVAIATQGAEFGIPLSDLANHESIHRTANGLLFVRSYRVARDGDRPDICAGGTLRGRATGLNDDGVGGVAAVVRNHDGETIGHLRGVYGVRDNGNQVFFAKLIGLRGEFMARARGVFERVDEETIDIAARFHQRGGRAVGVIRGRLVTDNSDDRPGVALLARWAYACDDSMPKDRLPPESDAEERNRGDDGAATDG